MKTQETKMIERVLISSCFGSNPKLALRYGATEVTIGFDRQGRKKKEIVDFLNYDAKKDIYGCYEIKVSMADYHSKAEKSFYGNYNYLVVSKELYQKQSLLTWKMELPEAVGLIVVDTKTKEKETVVKSKYQAIDDSDKDTLKTSLLRTLFYQNNK